MSASKPNSALVIGGTSGLGQAIAELLIDAGQSVIVAGRSATNIEPLVSEGKFNWRSLGLHLDLRNRQSIDAAAEQVAENDQHLNVRRIFMVAGRGLKGPILDQADDQLDDLLAVNLAGQARFLGKLFWGMKMRGICRPFQVVVVSSTTAWKARADETWYAATKAGLDQFARGLSRELSNDFPGSQVILVHPGGIKGTDFYQDLPDVDTNSFMEPVDVARIITDHALNHHEALPGGESLLEMQIERDGDGNPVVSYGARLPQ